MSHWIFFRQIVMHAMISKSNQIILTRKIVKFLKLEFFRQIAMF